MPSGFRFRSRRAEFCFTVDMIDEDPYLYQDCQVSVRDCTVRFAGDQPDELKLVESKQYSLAHTAGEA
jgi:hypothetical protein